MGQPQWPGLKSGVGEGVGDCRYVVVTKEGVIFGSFLEDSGQENFIF